MGLLEAETVIDLCTVAQVRTHLDGLSSSTNSDAIIQDMIDLVSRQAMLYMGRALSQTTHTEYFDIEHDGQKRFMVLGYPITSTAGAITAIYNHDTPRVWTDTTNDQISSNYIIVNTDRAYRGEIYIDRTFTKNPSALKITYVGGIATNTTGIPADMNSAACIQVADMYRRRKAAGAGSMSGNQTSVSWTSPFVWLNSVREVLDLYRRGRGA